ncbi:hypothetical protein LBMAG52_05140 [Planctomycetia bacterium]|nr:hypothetical protein LBMAG52_05140 [Planctomycetia bacterium]
MNRTLLESANTIEIEELLLRRGRYGRSPQFHHECWPEPWSGGRVAAVAVEPRLESASPLLATHRLVGFHSERRVVLTPSIRCELLPKGSRVVATIECDRLWIGICLPTHAPALTPVESEDALVLLSLSGGMRLERDRIRYREWKMETTGASEEESVIVPGLFSEERVGTWLADAYELFALPWSLLARLPSTQPLGDRTPKGFWFSLDWPGERHGVNSLSSTASISIHHNVGLFTDQIREVLHPPLVSQIDEHTLSIRPCSLIDGRQQVRVDGLRDDGGVIWPESGHLRLPGPRYRLCRSEPAANELCRIHLTEPVCSPVLSLTFRPSAGWSRSLSLEPDCEEIESAAWCGSPMGIEEMCDDLPTTLLGLSRFLSRQTVFEIGHWVDSSSVMADSPRPFLQQDGELWATVKIHAALRSRCQWSDADAMNVKKLLQRRLNRNTGREGMHYVVELG